MSSLQILTNTFILPLVTLSIVRKAFRIVKHYALTELILRVIFFDVHYNNLEKWLSEKGYSEKLVHKEIQKARSQTRETVLDKEKMSRNNDRVTLILRTIRSLKTLKTF